MEISKLLGIFIQGMAVGSGPCFLLCAPIVLPFVAGTQRSVQEGLSAIIEFSIGRIVVYTVLGALFGYFGYWLYRILIDPRILSAVWILVSLYLVALGIMLASGRESGYKFCRNHSGENLIMLGILIGLSPCFPLLSIMTEIALLSKNPAAGAGYGLAFGLGTTVSPLIVLGAALPFFPAEVLRGENARRFFARLCGLALILTAGYLLIFRY